MPRCVRRRIRGKFHHNYFKPCEKSVNEIEGTTLLSEEMEAIRLADYESLYQEEAASKMEISRSTFSRILNSARKKIAEALIEGKVIEIENL